MTLTSSNPSTNIQVIRNMKKGFTLIELLIVMSVIGILATSVIVSTGLNVNKSRQASGRTTMRSVLTNMILCLSGNSSNTAYVANTDMCSDPLITNSKWPILSPACTSFSAGAGTNIFIGVCGGVTITCNANLGSCI